MSFNLRTTLTISNARRNEYGNLLLLAIFFKREVFGLQARDRLAVLVGYDHIHDDEPGIGANSDGRNIGWCLLGTQNGRASCQVQN